MIRALIETSLGSIGMQIFRFYQENSLLINGIVVLYGALIVMSWTNLASIRKRLVGAIAAQIVSSQTLNNKSTVKRILSEVDIPWQAALDDVRFPLIAQQTAFWPKKKSVDELKEMLPADELVKRALEILKEHKRKTRRTN